MSDGADGQPVREVVLPPQCSPRSRRCSSEQVMKLYTAGAVEQDAIGRKAQTTADRGAKSAAPHRSAFEVAFSADDEIADLVIVADVAAGEAGLVEAPLL